MRWDDLFADLEAAADEESAAQRREEVADRSRAELGRLRLLDRLRPALGAESNVRIGVLGQQAQSGVLRALAPEWLLLGGAMNDETLVPLVAVQWVAGLDGAAAEPGWEGAVGARLGLRVVLRRIVRDRSEVQVTLTGGESFRGRFARVGADHVDLELRERTAGEASAAPQRRIIPLESIALVRRR